jgi:hypothetical protein
MAELKEAVSRWVCPEMQIAFTKANKAVSSFAP